MNPTYSRVITEMGTPANFLRNAARYLERNGWCQSDTYAGIAEPDATFPLDVNSPLWQWPPADAAGAIGIVVHGYAHANPYDPAHGRWKVFAEVCNALWDYLDERDDFYRDVPDADLGEWNDQPDMTAERVIAALNQAADRWESCNR